MGKNKKEKPSSDENEERFDSSKPQFRRPVEKSSKVVLDDRFASVLTDPRFQLDVADKYGRRNKSESKEELSAFYTVSESEPAVKSEREKVVDTTLSSDSESIAPSVVRDETKKSHVNKDDEDPASRIAYLKAFSRGEIDLSSSEEEDADGSDDDSADSFTEVKDPVHGKTGVLDPNSSSQDEEQVIFTTEESPYMAVLNMDWSHVRAVDIFTILSSFAPPGAVKRVQVYLSDFGKERLARDERFGPVDIWKKKKNSSSDFDEDEQAERYNPDDYHSRKDFDGGDGHDVNMNDSDSLVHDINSKGESTFDPEKLRKYEASRLKYYFAVVQYASPSFADIAYKEVDGLEFEHSSAAMDIRTIPMADLDDVIKNRELRDEATNIPSNYVPPEFVVNALQQSSVQCTWDMGDRDRETRLTKYNSGHTWGQLTESDDLKAYLASDHSSDEELDEENERATQMRKMLGLDSDDNDENDDESDSEISSECEGEQSGTETSKKVSFVPGMAEHATKLRLDLIREIDKAASTPWEKYQEKRKQKRREKRHAARDKQQEVTEMRKNGRADDKPTQGEGDFIIDAGSLARDNSGTERFAAKQTGADLELLVAGDEDEGEAKDFDMRGLQRLEKNRDKRLRGARKRKEEKIAANIKGADFTVDTTDARFNAVFEGNDDRFGIDLTDSNFKETAVMRAILVEQTRRRKRKTGDTAADQIVPDVSAEATETSSGSEALSALVKRIKSRVDK